MNEVIGTFAYENWKAFMQGEELQFIAEYPLYTDAHITGEITDGLGPYSLINTVPIPNNKDSLTPNIIFRLHTYLDLSSTSDLKETDTKRYHGGRFSDEIPALISLCMGVRIKSGSVSRYFELGGDPKGRPRGPIMGQIPVMIKSSPHRGHIFPHALGTHNLESTNPIRSLPLLAPNDAIAVVRASRLYQNALWIIESEPELSWLLLVSAVEMAANHWRGQEQDDFEVFSEVKPDLTNLIEDACGHEVAHAVAKEFAPSLGSAKKFREFIISFLPSPPPNRPRQGFQISWKKRVIKNALVKIYDYRSRALHAGTPFPFPMCVAPRMGEEKPIGLATSSNGGVWVARDLPMLLHTFEYLVRNALLEWWKSLAQESTGE